MHTFFNLEDTFTLLFIIIIGSGYFTFFLFLYYNEKGVFSHMKRVRKVPDREGLVIL